MSEVKREAPIRKSIFAIGIFKGLTIGITFLLVPLMIQHIGITRYGAWVTLLSVFSWISLIEVGIGNSLRNKVTECFARGEDYLAKVHISTAYYLVFKIAFILTPVLVLGIYCIDLKPLFNIQVFSDEIFVDLSLILVIGISISLIISPYKSIAFSLQMPTLETFAQFLQQTLFILGVLVLIALSIKDVRFLGFIYSSALLITGLVLSAYLYHQKPNLFPRLAMVDTVKTRQMRTLGVGFFIIQISGLIIYSTDNLIIAHVMGESQVTIYSVVMKLFMAINLLQVTIQTPLWSAYTDAYKKGDLFWIKRVLRKLLALQVVFGAVVLVLALSAQQIIRIWIGGALQIPDLLIWVIAAYTFVLLWNNLFSYLLNGISKIRLGTILFAVAALINIPLSIYFADTMQMGAAGVAMGTICSILPGAIISPIQVYFYVNTKKQSRALDAIFS